MARSKITMQKQVRNTVIYNDFLKAIGGKCNDTISIYIDGKFYAHYSRTIGYDVFDDISAHSKKSVDMIDDQTGEILKHKEA